MTNELCTIAININDRRFATDNNHSTEIFWFKNPTFHFSDFRRNILQCFMQIEPYLGSNPVPKKIAFLLHKLELRTF